MVILGKSGLPYSSRSCRRSQMRIIDVGPRYPSLLLFRKARDILSSPRAVRAPPRTRIALICIFPRASLVNARRWSKQQQVRYFWMPRVMQMTAVGTRIGIFIDLPCIHLPCRNMQSLEREGKDIARSAPQARPLGSRLHCHTKMRLRRTDPPMEPEVFLIPPFSI